MSLDNPGLEEEFILKNGVLMPDGSYLMPGNLKVKLSLPEHRKGKCRYNENCRNYDYRKLICDKYGGSRGAVDVTENCYRI